MLLKKINQIPLTPLIILTLFLGLAPFSPEPHLSEKIRMLLQGSLKRPIDIFDLIMHAAPGLVLIIRLATQVLASKDK